jgi:hypothetical protein
MNTLATKEQQYFSQKHTSQGQLLLERKEKDKKWNEKKLKENLRKIKFKRKVTALFPIIGMSN